MVAHHPACCFCHHEPTKPVQRHRPTKHVRDTCKLTLDVIFQRPNDAERHRVLQYMAAEDPYVRLLIKGRLDAEFAASLEHLEHPRDAAQGVGSS